ncbi:hypothetical protein JW926_07450, partial [Candidatus Sumerlaeota bacterium]|nr:hypothetical protein [Candidatus Sumerlaeota bacterium]
MMKKSFGMMSGIVLCLLLCLGISTAQITPPPKPCVNPNAKQVITKSEPGYFPLGFRPNLTQPENFGPGEFKPKVKALPIAWDWRANAGCTPVKDQGSWPTCWIFASTGEVESKIKIKEAPPSDPDYSEMDILEGVTEGTRPPADPLEGGHTKEVANHLSRYANLYEASNPYSTGGAFPNPPIASYWSPPKGSPQRVAREWHDLGDVDALGYVPLLKNIIYTEGPVSATVSVTRINAWSTVTPGIMIPFNSMSWNSNWVVPLLTGGDPNHGILIIGWDDNKLWYGGGGSGAWLVKNSWGTSWGLPSADAGYFWIAYGSARIGAQAGYYPKSGLTNYDSNETLLHYDEFGSWGSAGWPSYYDIYALNVFTPPAHGRINAVQFWATWPNIYYDVRIFDAWTDDHSTPTVQLGGRASGTVTDAGLYTVPIDPPAKVHSGDDIYVLVRFIDLSLTQIGLIPYEVDA